MSAEQREALEAGLRQAAFPPEPALDIVIEGTVAWIDDRQQLQRIGDAYQDKYGWPVTVAADGAFDAPYGGAHRRTSPYRVYELTPTVAYAFGTGNNLGKRSTRYRYA